MSDSTRKLPMIVESLLATSIKLEVALTEERNTLIEEIFRQMEEILLLIKEISQAEEPVPSNLDQHILDNAWLLTKSSLTLLKNLRSLQSMEVARVESDETYYNITEAFVAVLNLMDYQAPSWYPVERQHLNAGVEVVVPGDYVLRGYTTFGAEPPKDLQVFPQIRR